MKNNKIQFATIGTSTITLKFLDFCNQNQNLSYYATYSRSVQKAKDIQASYHSTIVYDDLELLLNDSEIDFIYIAVPNSLHFSYLKKIISKGIHVFCENPLITNMNEFKEIQNLVNKYKVCLFEGLKSLYHPNLSLIKSTMKKVGKINQVFFHRARFSERYNKVLQGEEVNVFSSDFAGGALMDLGVYSIHLAIELFGRPDRVDYFPNKNDGELDLNGTIIMQYKDFICTIISSKVSTLYSSNEIAGDEGTLTFDDVTEFKNIKVINHNKSEYKIKSLAEENSMLYEVNYFVSLLSNTKELPHFENEKNIEVVTEIMEKCRLQNGIYFPNDNV